MKKKVFKGVYFKKLFYSSRYRICLGIDDWRHLLFCSGMAININVTFFLHVFNKLVEVVLSVYFVNMFLLLNDQRCRQYASFIL